MAELEISTQQQPEGESLERRFARANVTNDGRLTLDQAGTIMPRVAREFQKIDIQRKGYVTLEEVRAFRRARAGKPPRGGGAG